MNIIFTEMIEDDKTKEDFYAFLKKYKVTLMTSKMIDYTKPTTAFREVLNMTNENLRNYLLGYFYVKKFDNRNLLFEMMTRVNSLTSLERKHLDDFLKVSSSYKDSYDELIKERDRQYSREARMNACTTLDPFKIKKIFKNFDDMGYSSIPEFMAKNGLSCSGEQLLDYLKVNGYSCEYNLLFNLKQASLNKCKKHFMGIKFVVEREYDRIHNGIEEDGQVRAYDMLDYYENCKFDKANFITYCKKFGFRITPQLHNFFKFSKFCSEAELLNGKYIIAGKEISENEKISAINYLKERKVPLSSMLFSLALRRIIK